MDRPKGSAFPNCRQSATLAVQPGEAGTKGARTGLSARSAAGGSNARTRLSALQESSWRSTATHEPVERPIGLDCASPLALSHPARASKSGRGRGAQAQIPICCSVFPQSKALSRRATAPGGFMVPTHAQKRKEATQESETGTMPFHYFARSVSTRTTIHKFINYGGVGPLASRRSSQV